MCRYFMWEFMGQNYEIHNFTFITFHHMNVVITGASRGLGKAIAHIFAQNEHNLYLTSRSEVALYKAVEELMTQYPYVTIKAKAFDLSIKEQAQAFGSWVLQFNVPVDVLVNNAGLFD